MSAAGRLRKYDSLTPAEHGGVEILTPVRLRKFRVYGPLSR